MPMIARLVTVNNNFVYEAKSVLLAGDEGLIEILPNHSDILLKLDVSIIKITLDNNQSVIFFSNGGLIKVKDGDLEISSSTLIKIESKSEVSKYYSVFKEKSENMKQTINKAISNSGFYEASSDDEFYLFEEERLAKFQVFNELIKGK